MNRWSLVFMITVVVASSRAVAAPPVTFEQALELARKHNESFQLADEELRRAAIARERAWAALLPSLRASGTFTHSDREISRDFGGGESVVFLKQDAFAGGITASMALFKGAALPELLRAYRLAAAARQTHRWTRASLEFEVARAYFAALAAENLLSAAERTLQSAKEHLEAARARREAGEAIAIDVTRARIEVVEARGARVRAQNALESSLDYLAFLIGRSPPIAIRRPSLGSLGDRRAPGAERPDLRAGELRIEAARRGVTASWLDYLPSLNVAWNYQATQNTGFSGDPDSWNLVFSLDWLLFDGGLRRATRHEQASRLRDEQLRLRQLRRQARQEVRQARRDLRTARVNLETSREQLRLARQNRELVISRYRAGLGTSLELVEADDALRKAEVAVVGGELELVLRELEQYRALGLDPRGKAIGG